MANARPQAPKFTTPKGVLQYPKLSQVDYGTKEYPNPQGRYSANLILKADDPAVQAFIDRLRPLHEKAVAKGDTGFKALKAETRKKLGSLKVNDLFTEILDQETEEPTGDLLFRFSMNASGEYRTGKNAGQTWDSRPPVFDRYAKLMIPGFRFRLRAGDEPMGDIHTKASPDIWGGTTAKVSFEVGLDRDGDPGYFVPGTGACGLKMGLMGVQVFDIQSGGARDASDYGFEAEDSDSPFEGEGGTDSTGDGADADF